MGEQMYREVMGLDEDAPLPDACQRCEKAVDAGTRHLLVVVHEYEEGGEDGAWCLCAVCADLCVGSVAERIEEPVN